MTTIAYKDGLMAADTKCSDDHLQQTYFRPKIVIEKDAVIAMSGEDKDIDRFLGWWRSGRTNPAPRIKTGEIGMIVAYFDGRVEIWCDALYGLPITEEYCAAGSGGHVALGAMYAGLTAMEGVRAAMLHDPNTGGKVEYVNVERAAKKARRRFV